MYQDSALSPLLFVIVMEALAREFRVALVLPFCLQCFDAVGWASGRASGLKKLSGGMLAWLSGMGCRLAYGPADATAAHCLLLQ